VTVVARKRVRGVSQERAKRVLENVEVRMEHNGNDVLIAAHLHEIERDWTRLFRGGRIAVDLEVTVPREVRLDAQTVSGELTIHGTRGPLDVQTVSGEVELNDVQGPLRLRTVSGDVAATAFAGALDANTVSGDVSFRGSRIRSTGIVAVSGDIAVDGELEPGEEHRFKTISGDVELALAGDSYSADFSTMSGDVEVKYAGAQTLKEDRRHHRVVIGSGDCRIRVKTVSGDFEIKRSGSDVPTPAPETASERPAEPKVDRAGPAHEILEKLARGEVGVDDAAAALDAFRDR
jgi:hypothetical protein